MNDLRMFEDLKEGKWGDGKKVGHRGKQRSDQVREEFVFYFKQDKKLTGELQVDKQHNVLYAVKTTLINFWEIDCRK